jgi:hypothetical protein
VRSGPWSRIFLAGCLTVYLVLAVTYALVFPPGAAPDEPAHFAYVLFIAENGRLPDYYADDVGYESYQAPLYYILSAGVCKLTMIAADQFAIAPDTAPPPGLREAAESDSPLPPGIDKHPWVPMTQYHLMVVSWLQALELSAMELAGWRAVRVFTALLGALGILITWKIVLLLLPGREWAAGAVAAGMSFLPMYVHISASVGNDPPTVVMLGLSTLLMLMILRDGPRLRLVALLGLSLGLGMLTKDSANVAIPVAFLALAWSAGRRYEPEEAASYLTDLARRIIALRWRLIAARGGLMLGVMALVAGWWYVRNYMLYGHALHYPANPQTQLPWDYYFMFPEHLWLALNLSLPMTFRNFWANFAWTNIAPPTWVYWLLLVVSLLPLPGLALLVADARAGRIDWPGWRRRAFAVVLITLALMALAVTGHALFIGLGGGSQGRYYFPVLFAFGLLAALGLGRVLPSRAREALPWVVGGGMLAFNLWCLFGLIMPFFRAMGA